MGVDDCIANNIEEYIAIALRLGTDREHRELVCSRILARKHLLYNSRLTVDELAGFLSSAVSDSHHEYGSTR
jgi:protein O-GlcNAc transferase